MAWAGTHGQGEVVVRVGALRRVPTAEASCSERCRPQTQSPKRVPTTSTLYAVQLLGAFISSFIGSIAEVERREFKSPEPFAKIGPRRGPCVSVRRWFILLT